MLRRLQSYKGEVLKKEISLHLVLIWGSILMMALLLLLDASFKLKFAFVAIFVVLYWGWQRKAKELDR